MSPPQPQRQRSIVDVVGNEAAIPRLQLLRVMGRIRPSVEWLFFCASVVSMVMLALTIGCNRPSSARNSLE